VIFMGKLLNFLFGDKTKKKKASLVSEPLIVKPKILPKGELRHKKQSLAQTKRILHRQQAKSSEDFNKKVNECRQWLEKINPWGTGALFEIYREVYKQSTNTLLALKVANSNNPIYPVNLLVNQEVERVLKARGHKYTLRKRGR